jgi:UDP-glucose 4-epimerase
VTVLVTGDRGRLGVALRRRLEADGVEVRGFDAADGHDVLDAGAVREAARGCRAIVHLAGLAEDRGGSDERFMELNVSGTYHVLLAAKAAGVERVVHASTGKVLGMLERDPAYLPMDDAHPGLPSRPYGLSKWLAEELCEALTNETGIATLCLRPVLVLDDEGWATLGAGPELPEARSGGWHLGVYVDGEDVADAFALALGCPDPGHARLLLCAEDIASARPTAELVAERLPDVGWRAGVPFAPGSHAALVDCTAARQVLGWVPRRSWRR